MSPIMKAWVNLRSVNITNPTTTADYFASQWVDPSDIFSVLLLLGPEIVQQAVAQLAGRTITPVAFSFGWVAYSAKALLSMIGDGRLMPETDMLNTLVIGADSKHVRTASSWILGRLLRDLDDRYDKEMEGEESHVPPSQSVSARPGFTEKEKGISHQQGKPWEALQISVYQVINQDGHNHGVPHCDWVWYSGFVVILGQLVIAMLPWVLYGQWVTLTQGNGSRHAVVILGEKKGGLDLEILARGTRTSAPSRVTRLAVALLAIQWIGLLITADGLVIDTWYLLGIGALGSIQNVIAAGARRSPSALGVHIRDIGQPIRGNRVADVLKAAERQYPGLGMSLVPIFFPGSMRVQPSEFDFWRAANERQMGPNRFGSRIDNLPPQSSTIQVVADVPEHDLINTEEKDI
ncbi:uncharacterized protein EAF02_003796 [Botrytis sinoallii]|uniref:uncharacterized protein n=1 Tax=Botrytis sinoallii TaxID=1463999 RepID=UPI00190141DE|nr:uncharacterized protein EAF02_003796 [Botrytis sinoallii]KAF7887149.1 hypothetical protein EAF02_003796 [Botrytis sinoallii]